ncbi:TetR family transcriptional regulator C-terminal domain-containing protein [Streptomyces iconiensis]|uniref:TetR family transcriptional regulator C-terminal domain-containing protein n=1 Tax=Streptomyces iconiensis TaxID=1384038 RepID=A0ABT6ZZG6_9ACTN|nr:TetR/AcrR family transcriptional regulator [Streptomyces iconiensis]MDJ1133798.1 TetR family transcriptional regulator C-terminal domain-containing protein [Streptomyces iconiensis]
MEQEADGPPGRIADSAGEVAARVRTVVESAGCTQREFARRIVMDPSKLSRSLSGTRRFTVAELARIADAGEVDAGWLLGSRVVGDGGVAVAGPGADVGAGPDVGGGPGAGAGIRAGVQPGVRSAGASSPVPPRAPRAPSAGRPLQIVRETVRLIAEHGFHAVRVADIAAACATSTAAIHYHFPGRAELLEAAVRWCMDEDTASRAARIAEFGGGAGEDAAAELRELLALQTPRTAQQRRQWLVWLDLWAEAARSTAIGRLHVEYYRQWRATVSDVIRRGIEQGVFRDVDPEFSALRLTALIDGLASQVLAGAADDIEGTGPDEMYTALLAYIRTELAV